MQDLWSFPRSISGQGVRDTLSYLGSLLPALSVHSVPSGTPVGDWVVPPEWNIRDAYIMDAQGNRLVDFRESTLHVVSYSVPVRRTMTRQELDPYLHFLEDQPDAIPYVTSYYEPRWGFCLSRRQYERLGEGPFEVVIDSTLAPGSLEFADLLIPGTTEEEVLLSSYICHPAMANNELSGPVVLVALARWIQSLRQRRYSYRVYLGPETIGAITYLSLHAPQLKSRVAAGWVLTCMGDERSYSYLPSRRGNTLSDKASLLALQDLGIDFIQYEFLDRGSDERQWCWPTIDLPISSLMRSKYGTFPEYHTSLDDLSFVTPNGLLGGLRLLARAVEVLETNFRPRATTLGEPQLGRRGLYPSLGAGLGGPPPRGLLDILTFADGQSDLIDIAEQVGRPWRDVVSTCAILEDLGLLARRHPQERSQEAMSNEGI